MQINNYLKGIDVSSGIKPDVEIDFSDCYRSHSKKELMECMVEKIENLK